MLIEEKRLRRIIRKKLLEVSDTALTYEPQFDTSINYKSSGTSPYAAEKGAKGLKPLQLATYIAHRVIFDATQDGAREVALGNVDVFEFTTYWGLNKAQKEATLDILGSAGDAFTFASAAFPPAAIIPISIGIVSAALKFSDEDVEGGIIELLGSVLIGALVTGRVAEKLGELVLKHLGSAALSVFKINPKNFLKALMTEGGLSLMPELRLAMSAIKGSGEKAASATGQFTARAISSLFKGINNLFFGQVDKDIASAFTKANRNDLYSKYLNLQKLVLTDENTVQASLLTAMNKIETLDSPGLVI